MLNDRSIIFYNPRAVDALCKHYDENYDKSGFCGLINRIPLPLKDRTGTLSTPFKSKILSPLNLDYSLNANFSDCCLKQAALLIKESESYDTVNLYWSGGIDSTVALVSLLRQGTTTFIKNKLMVVCSEASIAEYPLFFDQFIKNKINYTFVDQQSIYLSHTALNITGELGDQLFGSTLLSMWKNDMKVWNQPYEPVLSGTFAGYNRDAVVEYLQPLIEACPFKIKTVFDIFWWINFTLKWDDVYMRIMLPNSFTCQSNTRHFFDTVDFQTWSVKNHDLKVRDTWNSCKWIAKDFIYAFTNDSEYWVHKVKVGSLPVRSRYTRFGFVLDDLSIVKYGHLDYSHNPQDFITEHSNLQYLFTS